MSTLSVYVHIPFCHRRCPYCSFYHVHPQREEAFVDALVAEATQVLGSLPDRPNLKTVFFGGGTPSVMSAASWERIFDAVVPRGQPTVSEITCEVNPEDVTDELLETVAALGVNRLSIGVQSMDAGAQLLLGRCPPEVNRLAIASAGRHFNNLSFDVLLGVPGREASSLEQTMDELIEFAPDHFSLYCLEPGGDLGKAAERFFDAIDMDRSADEYLRVCERLKKAGFHHYEVSNFAQPERESAHNRVYWDGGDYVGLGPAAHSYMGGRRFHNPPSLDGYLASAGMPGEERWIFDDAGPEGAKTERLMLSLRTDKGIALEALSCPEATINGILEQGYAEVSGGRLTLTDHGFLLLNEIALRLGGGFRDRS